MIDLVNTTIHLSSWSFNCETVEEIEKEINFQMEGNIILKKTQSGYSNN